MNRITIPLGDLHARVKAAAEKARQSMTQYILTAIEQRLARDAKEGTMEHDHRVEAEARRLWGEP